MTTSVLCLAKGKNRLMVEFYDSGNHKFLFPQGENMVTHRPFLTEERKLLTTHKCFLSE